MLAQDKFFLTALCNCADRGILPENRHMKYILSCLLLSVITISFVPSPRTIKGRVTDDSGHPLAYASIVVKSTGKGVATAADGSFSLQAGDNDVLLVSYVGFVTKEIKAGKKNYLEIQLQPDAAALNEVVATANMAMMQKTVATREALSAKSAYTAMPALAMNSYFGGGRTYDAGYPYNREGYDHITENGYRKVADNPLSTFSIDVDAASYSNVRRILKEGQLPQQGAVRVEEMINYFSYRYDQPANNEPFAVHTELAVCPWNPQHQIALIALQAKKMDMAKLPPSNLTFLIDVSGSMMSMDKLPLVKESLKLLTDQLREEDRVSIVVYAGNAGLVLPSVSGDQKMRIKEAINRLEAGGSTAGGAGIQLAYKTARENFFEKGNNRVILCTDGDFNVGLSSDDALERMIEEERNSGVFLTVLGFGTGNYQDAKMQKLADKGNGNHAYIDQLSEAKKVLVSEFGGTLFAVAKDVKLQVEFNPQKVQGYRLIGYENRMLAKEDFNDDRKDAGELGSGHTVTALYEIVPKGVAMPVTGKVDSLRYQTVLPAISTEQEKFSGEVLAVKVRYKAPDAEKSKALSFYLKGSPEAMATASANLRFASAVASFGMLLRNSEYKGSSTYRSVLALAENALGDDTEGYRKEFLQLVSKAQGIGKGE
jgi:Ca-activated chloride channel family protein